MEEKLKRGCILSGWLWLQLIGSIIGIIITLAIPLAKIPGVPETSLMQEMITTIINVVFLISIIGILRWKKVFTYGYIGATLISFVYTFIGKEFKVTLLIAALIGIVLNLWAAYALLKLFKKLESQDQDTDELKNNINL